jgi:hypothetical protein
VKRQGWDGHVEGETIMINNKPKVITVSDLCPVVKKYGLALSAMRLTNASLYSCVDKIQCLVSSSIDYNLEHQKMLVEKHKSIAQVIQTNTGIFFLQSVSTSSEFYVDGGHSLIQLRQWAVGVQDCIDISFEAACTFTNSSTIDEACAIMRMACQAGLLKMVVVYDRYRRSFKDDDQPYSIYYGAPLIDTNRMFSCIKNCDDTDMCEYEGDDRYWKFSCDFTVTDDEKDSVFTPILLVSKKNFPASSGSTDIKTNDFVLCSPNHNTPKSYFVRLLHPVDNVVIWSGYFRIVKPGMISGTSGAELLDDGKGARSVPFWLYRNSLVKSPWTKTKPRLFSYRN